MSRRAHEGRRVLREETRLRKIFERILLVSLVVPAAMVDACSSSSTNEAPVDLSDASNDASSIPVSDANVVDGEPSACAAESVYIDAAVPDGSVACDIFNRFSCGIPPVTTPRSDCFFSLNDCPSLCPGAYFFNCHAYGNWCVDGSFLSSDDGGITLDDGSVVALDPEIVECATCPNGAGRRPRGLAPSRRERAASARSSALGHYFAETAHLEKASIVAFRILRADLMRLGAPRELVRSADRAARDEVRHARETARIARRFRANAPHVCVDSDNAERTIEDLAIENAVEGCVRETFGALVASWQAATAQDKAIAIAMRGISTDETRHAALAWSIAEWSMKRLDFASRQRARAAAENAIVELEAAATREPHPDLVCRAGVPDMRTQREMLRELRQQLWL